MDATKIAAIRKRVDAVNAQLPTVTDLDLLATVAGTDAEMLLDELVATQARVKALEAALAFYADEDRYCRGEIRCSNCGRPIDGDSQIDDDNGEIARSALAGEG